MTSETVEGLLAVSEGNSPASIAPISPVVEASESANSSSTSPKIPKNVESAPVALIKCSYCTKEYLTTKSLKRHMSSKHSTEDSLLDCPICHIKKSTRFQMLHHVVEHLNERHFEIFECPMEDCCYLNAGPQSVFKHYYEVHDKDGVKIVCKSCSSTFKNFENLWRHFHLFHDRLTKERNEILKQHPVSTVKPSVQSRIVSTAEEVAAHLTKDAVTLKETEPLAQPTIQVSYSNLKELLLDSINGNVESNGEGKEKSSEETGELQSSKSDDVNNAAAADSMSASVDGTTVAEEGVETPRNCPHCNITFADETLYFMHISLHGTEEGNAFVCQGCGVETGNKFGFALHIVTAAHSAL